VRRYRDLVNAYYVDLAVPIFASAGRAVRSKISWRENGGA
jgi:hypothetical protein